MWLALRQWPSNTDGSGAEVVGQGILNTRIVDIYWPCAQEPNNICKGCGLLQPSVYR